MRPRVTVAGLLAGISRSFGLSACTPSDPAPGPTLTHTRVISVSPSSIPTTPVAAGPTTTTTGRCPGLSLAKATSLIGQRLDHLTVQISGGRTIGCTFYPITTGYAESEHLPTHGYPSARITVATYPGARSARQVLAIVSRAGMSPSLQSVNGLVAETFQTHFYPPDGDQDWACAFIKGPKLITIFVAESTGTGQANALALAETFASNI